MIEPDYSSIPHLQEFHDAKLEAAPQHGLTPSIERHSIRVNNNEWYIELPQGDITSCTICEYKLATKSYCGNRNHVYCFSCIDELDRKKTPCPFCRDDMQREHAMLEQSRVILNQEFKGILISAKLKCVSCEAFVDFFSLNEHADNCNFGAEMLPAQADFNKHHPEYAASLSSKLNTKNRCIIL